MALKNNTPKNKGIVITSVIIILLLDLFFLYYVKYNNQSLSLSDFQLGNIGNILNLVFTSILIVGLIIYLFQKKNFVKTSLIITLTLVITFILVIAVLTTIINISLPEYYIAGQPLSKVITGFLFFSYQFILFVFIAVLWLSLLGRKELIALRAVMDSAILVLILLFISFFYHNIRMDESKKVVINKNESNMAVVLGAAVWSNNKPSPSLASRVDKAADLFQNNTVGKLMFTGSNAPGELSEAEVAYNYIQYRNIDNDKIFLEKNTTSTSEQILFIKSELIPDKNIKNVIIVSDAYHLPRVKEICKFFDIEAYFAASDLRLSFQNNLYSKIRESVALLVFWFFAL